jgi:hypothetical protein
MDPIRGTVTLRCELASIAALLTPNARRLPLRERRLCCAAGTTCKYVNDYYHQCQPTAPLPAARQPSSGATPGGVGAMVDSCRPAND